MSKPRTSKAPRPRARGKSGTGDAGDPGDDLPDVSPGSDRSTYAERAEPAAPTRSGRIALVGRPNVGKSTLLNALLGEPIAIISPHPQTTRDTVRGVLTTTDTQYVFVDTPGLHAPKTRLGHWMNDIARQAARDADILVFLVEAPREGFAPRLATPDSDLAGELPKLPTVLVINKIDELKDKTGLLPLLGALGQKHTFAATVPMSARRMSGISGLLRELRELLPEQPFLFPADTLSDQPTRFFVAEFIREQILKHTKQEVPHGVAVVVERYEEGDKNVHIDVAIHVARDSHKKILIGAKGSMLKTIGAAARTRVETMIERRVQLKLFVRATPGWMDDPARLRDLGYEGAAPAPTGVREQER